MSMKNATGKGTLAIGYRDEAGTCHKDFEMRLPTLEDIEEAIADAGEGACQARVSRHVWARTITRLGTLPAEAIDASLLAGLADVEYGRFADVEASIRKKLQAESESSGS
ncbi:hypothetical protein [Nitratidesulfovibrio vulgaris]|uniref:hypothetical protein n=1 Tax=Nitratidesulfovibrio vulgaris TaxID=881 RepID=UPI0013E07592|nr:hypothetical protein [Nitratidesulfovibrio vulgaris]